MLTTTSNPETSTRLRVAVVGAGYVATHHLSALKKLDFVHVVGICDSNLVAAQALASRFDVHRSSATLPELADAQPQAVYVLTPPASHPAIALAALDMGCHVLVEKPMADSVLDCEKMIAAARARGLLLGVNHSDLLDPMLVRALQAVRDGRIGKVLSVDIVRNSEYPPYAGGPLPGSVTQGSYPFRDLGVHGLYTIEAFLGPIEHLAVDYQASGADPNLHFDEWQARARTARGVGRLLLSWNARPMENRVFVRGTQGTIEVDRFLQTCRMHRALPGPKFIGIVANAFISSVKDVFHIPWNVLRFATGALQPSPGIRHGARAFAESVRDGSAPPFSGEDALRLARLLEPACAEPDRQRLMLLEGRYAELPPADVLVTGAAGFLGGKLVARLRSEGRSVRVLVRRPVPAYTCDAGIQVVVGDLGDPRIVDHAVRGVAVVYHVGAAMRGGARDFESGTSWGTSNVVEACLSNLTQRLVYVSSMSVFDHAGRDLAATMTEDSALEPHPDWRGAYTQTKLGAEHCVREAIEQRGLPAVILRPGQIFGPGAEQVTPNGVISLAGRWVAVGGGSQALPLVYVDDVIDALLLAEATPAASGGTFNIVDTATVTQEAYLQRVQRKLGTTLKRVRVPGWVFMCLGFCAELLGKVLKREVPLTRYRIRSLRPLSNFDTRAARDRLRWTPRIGVRRGLDLTFGDD